MPSLARAYRNKVSNKLTGVVHMPAQGACKGTVLLSYLTGPFTKAPGEFFTDPHSGYWECEEIARLLSVRGYAVDCINFDNQTFVPKKQYVACIDIKWNLERLAKHLGSSAKVMHIVSSDPSFQDAAEEARLTAFAARRGITPTKRRYERPSRNPAFADHLEGFGNAVVHESYSAYDKTITPIPISVSQEFPFQERDMAQAKNEFLFFSGGGAILKGLDLVMEAFADMPQFTLHIVGPAGYEKEIEETYAKELTLSNIHRHPRPKRDRAGALTIDGTPFMDIVGRCGALIYPSSSEGTSGSVIQAMHAGVCAIVTPQTGIPDGAPVTLLPVASVQAIRDAALQFASLPANDLHAASRATWEYARAHHTKETFSNAYSAFLDTCLP